MESPDSGIASGSCRRSSRTERVMRRCGTFASASVCAVRSTIRSWKENRQAPRAPREGDTKPASTRARIVLRDRRSIFSTSRTPYAWSNEPSWLRELGFLRDLAYRRRGGGLRWLRALGRLACRRGLSCARGGFEGGHGGLRRLRTRRG